MIQKDQFMKMNETPVRLKPEQIQAIKALSGKIFDSHEVWIFGSRADLSQKGGDIDIYIQTQKQEEILQAKIIFLREFEKQFGEQKVDLIVDNQSIQKEIYQIAKRGIKL